jgi:cell fate regulator YaaT (PSP1 superfamily)
MSETPSEITSAAPEPVQENQPDNHKVYYYRIRFRSVGQEYTVSSQLPELSHGNLVMVKTDHGAEPAMIAGRAAGSTEEEGKRGVSYVVERQGTQDDEEKYTRLPILEQEGFDICLSQIKRLHLPMHLVRVERYFNGSKIIFYFTADSRVDFRELVKHLVQEFRTRVEMRQIGVRHETQMTGGLGACGRELCCTSFLKHFDSVSIKMAKTQDLPLNPAKISGVCNRLLCCLTYEYESYHTMKKGMPRVGRSICFEDAVYRVVRLMALKGSILTIGEDGVERVLSEEEWRAAKPVQKPKQKQKGKKYPRKPQKKSPRQAKGSGVKEKNKK